MTLPQTTQQFTPIILGLDLTIKDQQAVVERYLEELPLSSHLEPQPGHAELTTSKQRVVTLNSFQGPRRTVGISSTNSHQPESQPRNAKIDGRHAGLDPASANLSSTTTSIANIIWLNQLDQPFGIEHWRSLLPQIQSTINTQTIVVVILSAETVSLATQNAMLKSLEEPPPNIQFLLATNRPTSLLPTIQSRCQLVRYSLLINGQAGIDRFVNQTKVESSTNQAVDQSKENPTSKSLAHELPASTNSTQSTTSDAFNLIKTIHSGSAATALIASDQFKDRDQAKDWIIQVLVWSQKQLSLPVQQENISKQRSGILEQVIDLDWPTWIAALLVAHQQLEQNLHVKLVMDQLFLVLVDGQR